MRHRRLGRTGLKVSEIAYGNWINRTEGEAVAVLRAALDAGITTFDTADVYGQGRAEFLLGMVLKQVPRHSVEISTKVYSRTDPGPNGRGLSRKHILEAAHASLRRLKVDYIDLYQAHRYDPHTPVEETLRAFDDLVRQGKVCYVGVSEWTPSQISDALRIADDLGLDRIVSDQPQYSLLWRVMEAEVQPLCAREGLGILAWSPLAQGLLTGKYGPGSPVPAGSRAEQLGARFATGGLHPDVLSRVAEFAALAAELRLSTPQLALAWVLSNPAVSAAIVGASSPEQVHQSARAAGVTLTPDVLGRIEGILGPVAERDPARIPSEPHDYRYDDARRQSPPPAGNS